ncbi:MAG: ribonuclease R [Candidatus Pacebacteria bacterium]|nr:ribonuclease R [Candidatus Paceibacterota bacterium]
MNKNTEFEGIYSLGKNGIAYIKNKETNDVIEVPAHLHNTALHRDIVTVNVTDAEKNEGEVTAIVSRANAGFVGILEKKGDHFSLKPDNFKIPEITIPNGQHDNAPTGEKVFVEITQYEPRLIGKVLKHLGKPGSNDAHMHGIAMEQGFDYSFPKEVDDEADALEAKGITEEEIQARRDMRNTLTFTIDPEDAKDFDDALSFKKLDNGNYEIGIHIADVAHYVRPGSALDKEAQKRTTSVYLVDRTIPMLPEALSNGLCSLRQDEEKLAFSAVFEINPTTGEVADEWFGRTVINSNKRFTYEEAQDIIDNKSGLYVEELLEFNRIAKIYEKQRYEQGALNFETHEVKFILDDEGVPVSVKVKERIDTNKLIEEFMLLANSRVAKYMNDAPFFVYRIHDKPEQEKMEKLQEFLKLLGYETKLKDGMIPVKELQRIIREAEGTKEYETLQVVTVRSMQKAIYTTKNIGHFGLAFSDYSHFTSPIRRYPDVLAHRLLDHKIKGTESDFDQEWFEKMCTHSSQQEQRAVTAERNSTKLKQVEYMKTLDPDTFLKGIVTGAGKFGVFVAEEESRSEGMIRLFDLGDDMWEYREKSGTIIGKKTQKTFKIGDEIDIKIKRVDLEKRLIDYALVVDGKSQEAPPRFPRKNRRKHHGKRKNFNEKKSQ